jgi:uncharacterized phage infection (PIP) family protein YhgE
MDRYVKVVLALAIVSFAIALFVLGGLFGFNPLHLSIVDRLADATNPGDEAAVVSALTGLSAAISTVFALAVGVIALMALIASEKSETRAIEQLKLDIASLASTLVSVRDRALLYTQVESINLELDPFAPERKALTKILTSPTGWAIHSWSHERGNEKYDDLFVSIAGLVGVTTLDISQARQAVINKLAERAMKVFDQLCSIEDDDFKKMSGALTHLSDGLSKACITLKTDKLAELQRQITEEQAKSYRAPTEEELAKLMKQADSTIGGASGSVVEQLGRAAIEGSPEDRERFHQLLQQLLGIELDDI